ncbi:MAG: hypothetical protein HYV23_03050 [Deltaproteobacteria bacterium]|nr:hypothetical protein [Deltaproteobacteria bacterium]
MGRDDGILGEAICAFIVLKDGLDATATELQRLCHENLPPYKVPRDIKFIKALPKTENMKIKRSELKKLIETQAEVN